MILRYLRKKKPVTDPRGTTEELAGDEKTSMINLPVMKLVGLYQCLDPGGPRPCGFHVFRSMAVVQVAYIVAFCALDMLTVVKCANDFNLVAKYAFLLVCAANTTFKLYYVVTRAPLIWDCLRLASFDFLSCGRRRSETAAIADILLAGRSMSITATSLFLFMWTFVAASWVLSPFYFRDNRLTVDCDGGVHGRYRYNSINIVVLVSDASYNRHFSSFYLVELLCFLWCAHATFVFDLLAMSLSITIVYQLKTVARSYHMVASEPSKFAGTTACLKSFTAVFRGFRDFEIRLIFVEVLQF